jgi:uncharacterized protein
LKPRVSVLNIDTEVTVPAADGCALATTVVRPAGPGSWPAVLVRTPYDRKTYASLTLQVHAPALAEAGYAVVLQDVRGRGGSEGSFEPFVNERSDGLDTVEWLTSQPWCDGNVGLAGISYNAFAQLAIATGNPAGVECWVPGLAAADVRTTWIRRGGVLDYGFHLAWGLGSIASTDSRTEMPERLLDEFDDPVGTARRDPADQVEMRSTPAGEWFFDWLRSPDPYPDNTAVPGLDQISAVSAPALVVGGWFDVFAQGSIELFRLLRSGPAGDGHRLVMGPWDHSGLPLGRRAGDRDFGRRAIVDLHELQMKWLDRYLKGGEDFGSDRIFVTGRNRWEEVDWPLSTVEHSFELGSDLRTPSAERRAIEVMVDPSSPTPSPGGAVFPWEPSLRPGAFDQRSRRSRPDVVSFETQPLSSEMLTAGVPVLSLPVTGSPRGAPVHACLVEVAPSGPVWNISDGVGAIDTSTGVASIELGPVAHQFSAGSSIGIDIAFAADVRLAPVEPGRRVIDLTKSQGILRLPVVP